MTQQAAMSFLDLGETINDLELSGFTMKGQRIDKLNSILLAFR